MKWITKMPKMPRERKCPKCDNKQKLCYVTDCVKKTNWYQWDCDYCGYVEPITLKEKYFSETELLKEIDKNMMDDKELEKNGLSADWNNALLVIKNFIKESK